MANVENTEDDVMYNENALYGEQTPTHRKIVESAWPTMRNVLSSIPFTTGYGPFGICDYGTTDGVNSLGLMTNCIDWVQKTYGENQQVHVVYEDRPNNDFNSLIRLVENNKNVFVTCCGRSLNKQCLPDATVHLGFSSMAVLWLSARPSVTSQEVFSGHFAEGSAEQRLFNAQAAQDWETFLSYRSKELVPGGRLVIATVSSGSCPCSNVMTNVRCSLRTMTDIWREMMYEKIISKDEFLVTFEPNSCCTAQYMSAPCDENNSRVMKYGLRIVAMETKHIECCWRKRWLMSNNQDDSAAARAHAISFVQSTRTWSNHIFATGLSKERNVEDREKILDEFYRRLVDQVAMAPADWGIDIAVHFVTVAKSDNNKTARDNALSFVHSLRTNSNRMLAIGLSRERNVAKRKKILDELFRRLDDKVVMAPADRGLPYSDHVDVAKTGEVCAGTKSNDKQRLCK